jgi:hypothetical protein
MSRSPTTSKKKSQKVLLALHVLLGCSFPLLSIAFTIQRLPPIHPTIKTTTYLSSPWREEPLVDPRKEEIMSKSISKSTQDLKIQLLDTVVAMAQLNPTHFKFTVETSINLLEEKYVSPLTLDFLNMILAGEWVFLFSTNYPQSRIHRQMRIQEISSTVQTQDLKGHVLHRVRLDSKNNVNYPHDHTA